MAWIKGIVNPVNGVTAQYWEVININYNHRTQKSLLSVGGWLSQSAYEQDLAPVLERSWEIASGLAPELAAGAVAFITSYARSQPEFEGSEDAA